MDGYIVHGREGRGVMAVPRGSLVLIEHGRGMQIELWDGELWITQERDNRDYLIGAGTAFRLEREGIVLAHALRGARVTLTAPVPAHYADRIVLTVAAARRASSTSARVSAAAGSPASGTASPATGPTCTRLTRNRPPQPFDKGPIMQKLVLLSAATLLGLAACNPADSVSDAQA